MRGLTVKTDSVNMSAYSSNALNAFVNTWRYPYIEPKAALGVQEGSE